LCVACKAGQECDEAHRREDGYSGRVSPPRAVQEEEFEESY